MSEAELRAMVRDVLREALAARKVAPQGAASSGGAAPNSGRGPVPAASAITVPFGTATPAVEPVAIASDTDLAAFVRRLTILLDDPATGAAVRAGRHRFTLASGRVAPAAAPAVAPAATVVLSGTESEVKAAAEAAIAALELVAEAAR